MLELDDKARAQIAAVCGAMSAAASTPSTSPAQVMEIKKALDQLVPTT